MTPESKEILLLIEKELVENQGARLTQVLFNLGINTFADEKLPDSKRYLFRDNYNDSDKKVLDRIKNKRDIVGKSEFKTVATPTPIYIVRNMAQCLKCNDLITSYYGHDYVSCSCGAISVDGGNNYTKRAGDISSYKELSIYSDAPFEVIRKNFHRGGRGKDGKQPLKWVAMYDMSNSWLEACITYNEERGNADSFANKMYRKELEYRKQNNISIEE